MRRTTVRAYYIIGVWLLAIPAVVLCVVFGVLGPFYMAAALLIALVLTFPLMAGRPDYKPALIVGLALAQVAFAYATMLLSAGRTHTELQHGLADAAWLIGAILPFAIAALVIRGARRDLRQTRL